MRRRERGPHLPAHDEAAADGWGAISGGADGGGGGFGAHADAEEAREGLLPGLRACSANHGEEPEDGREEDGAAAAKVEVERVGEPAAAAVGVGDRFDGGAGETHRKADAMDVRGGVDEPDDPTVALAVGFAVLCADARLLREGQVCAAGAGLVPAPFGVIAVRTGSQGELGCFLDD